MKLFKIWAGSSSRKVAIRAFDEDEALDIFCEMNGWNDYAEFCTANGSDYLHIEAA